MNVEVLKEIADLSVQINDRLSQSDTLGGKRFLGLLFTNPNEDGKRRVKFIIHDKRRIVSKKMWQSGRDEPDKWVVGILLDRDQNRVDAYGHRAFRDGENDPLHMQSR